MTSYDDIKRRATERQAASIRSKKVEQEDQKQRIEAASAVVTDDICRELTEIGEVFGRSGLFRKHWRVHCQFTCWKLQGYFGGPLDLWPDAVHISLSDHSDSGPTLYLYGCDLKYLDDRYASSESVTVTAEVTKRISECLAELNKRLHTHRT